MKTKVIEILITAAILALLLAAVFAIGEHAKVNNMAYGWSGPVERVLIESGVDNVDDCLSWAFGEDYKKLEQRELDDQWRQRHIDLFIIRGTDDLVESTRKIAKAWLVYFEEKDNE